MSAALPVARLLADLAAVGAVAGLLVRAVVADDTASRRVLGAARAAARWAALWCLSTAAAVVLTLSAADGGRPAGVADAVRAAWSDSSARPLVLTVVLAAVAAILARGAGTPREAGRALAVALVALTPVMAAPHEDGGTGLRPLLAVHVVAATLWAGAVLGLVLHLRDDRPGLAVAAGRTSRLALACFLAVALTGPLTAVAHLRGPADLWGSPYGRLVVVKLAALLTLGAIGLGHRKATLRQLSAGRSGAFLRLTVVELTVMVATIGVAVGLSRTEPPGAGPGAAGHAGEHAARVEVLAPLSPSRLVLEWQWAPAVTVVTLVALLAYLASVLGVTGSGQPWPWRRTAAAIAAAVLTLLTLTGGVAVYASALQAVHVAQYLTLLLLVPALIVHSAPLTLAGRVGRRPAPGRLVRLTDPVLACCILIGLTTALYGTPLLELTLRSPDVHAAVQIAAVATGLCFWTSVLAVEPSLPRRPASDRIAVLVGALLFLVAFGVVLASRDTSPATSWADVAISRGGTGVVSPSGPPPESSSSSAGQRAHAAG